MNSNIMDFSRNSHGFNGQDDMNNMNQNDEDFIRRLTASRGLPVGGQDNGFALGGTGAGTMFGQGVPQNQFPGAGQMSGSGNSGMDPRFSMMHQA